MSPGRKRGDEPKVRRDRKGYAFLEWGGKRHALGRYGTPEYFERKEACLRLWREEAFAAGTRAARASATVAGLARAFLAHARTHYVRADKTPTGECGAFDRALRPVIARCADRATRDFTADDLKAVRDQWVRDGLTRKEVNKRVGKVRQVFRWGIAEKLAPAAVVVELEALADLQAGRTPAPEQEEVGPAVEADVLATLPHLPRGVRAMVRLQLLCGMRPGEACRMKGKELHRESVRVGKRTYPIKNWAFLPAQHKTGWRGQTVCYFLNAEARAVVTPFLRDDPEAYLFQPLEDYLAWRETRPPGEYRKRPFRSHYEADRYGKWVRRACELAGIPVWSPHQLRHLWFSKADRIAGIETASQAGGHTSLNTTAIYVERRLREADDLADRMGH